MAFWCKLIVLEQPVPRTPPSQGESRWTNGYMRYSTQWTHAVLNLFFTPRIHESESLQLYNSTTLYNSTLDVMDS